MVEGGRKVKNTNCAWARTCRMTSLSCVYLEDVGVGVVLAAGDAARGLLVQQERVPLLAILIS